MAFRRRLQCDLARSRVAPALVLVSLALGLSGTTAHAKSWCAVPLIVHEWGVHVFGSGGEPGAPSLIPTWFHRSAPGDGAAVPVRSLPADMGDRDLPVLHFYAPAGGAVPLGLEVGFSGGPATAWFPSVDGLRSAAEANSAAAGVARAELVLQRAARSSPGAAWDAARAPLPADPTRQLVWNRIDLDAAPTTTPAATDVPWVKAARAVGGLWANVPGESERFVFYEARTQEKVPLVFRRGETWAPGRRHYELVNDGAFAVHDVFVVQRDGARVFVFFAPSIPAKASAGFVIEDHELVGAAAIAAGTVGRLSERLVDAKAPVAPTSWSMDMDDCVMQRDPAIPRETAEGHRLYRPEVELLLGVWQARFFERPGTTLVYREDVGLLDAVMPLSLYTDMRHYVVLRRAGLAVQEQVQLP